jgi:anaerobic carbon-monoxide dehydrogenase iron sulfur subunit
MNGKVLVIDERKCNGCMLCAVACSIRHFGDIALERSQIKVWRTEDGLFIPLTCHHCETPSCAGACPCKACRESEDDGRVIIDDTQCIGCRACNMACPFGHAHYDEVARVSTKCDYCDGEPECVRVCEPGAIRYVPSDECSRHRKRESAMVLTANITGLSPAGRREETDGK